MTGALAIADGQQVSCPAAGSTSGDARTGGSRDSKIATDSLLEITAMVNDELMRSVADAAIELCCGNADLTGRLLFAVRALNVALIRQEEWPAMLRRRAQEISDELKVGGTPERTIATIDPQSARRLAERILQLYADCHASAAADRS
jgi:hypothetical protein